MISKLNKCLVIGSNSFSGSHFVDLLLKKNIKVFGVSRSKEAHKVFLKYKQNKNLKKFNFTQININYKKDLNKLCKILKKNNIKFIVNFASQGMVAESWKTPEDWYLTNTLSHINLIREIMNKTKIKKFLHISTPEVYGDNLKYLYENSPHNPSTPYAISRSATDFHLKALNKVFKFPVMFARAANVYGPGQQLYRIIPKTIMSLKKNLTLPLHGGGRSIRSFIHIEDAVKAYFLILQKGKINENYHVSTDNFISIKYLVNKICKIMKIKNKNNIKIEKNDRLGKDKAYFLISKHSRKKLKWKHKISIDEGIKDTLDWVNNNFNFLKKNKLKYIHKK